MTMTLVSSTTVGGSSVASVDFTNIPQTAKDLLILVNGRSDLGGVAGGITIRYNNDSSGNYGWFRLVGDNSSVSVSSANFQTGMVVGFSVNGTGATANTFSNVAIYVPGYTTSSAKTLSAESVASNSFSETYTTFVQGRWGGTSAITSVLVTLGGNFTTNTIISLYTIE
jgi:hypothetical protein